MGLVRTAERLNEKLAAEEYAAGGSAIQREQSRRVLQAGQSRVTRWSDSRWETRRRPLWALTLRAAPIQTEEQALHSLRCSCIAECACDECSSPGEGPLAHSKKAGDPHPVASLRLALRLATSPLPYAGEGAAPTSRSSSKPLGP